MVILVIKQEAINCGLVNSSLAIFETAGFRISRMQVLPSQPKQAMIIEWHLPYGDEQAKKIKLANITAMMAGAHTLCDLVIPSDNRYQPLCSLLTGQVTTGQTTTTTITNQPLPNLAALTLKAGGQQDCCRACGSQLGTDRLALCDRRDHQFHTRCIGDNENVCPCCPH